MEDSFENSCQIDSSMGAWKRFESEQNLAISPILVNKVSIYCHEGKSIWAGPAIYGEGDFRTGREVIEDMFFNELDTILELVADIRSTWYSYFIIEHLDKVAELEILDGIEWNVEWYKYTKELLRESLFCVGFSAINIAV